MYGSSRLNCFVTDPIGALGNVQSTADVADQGRRDGLGSKCHVLPRSRLVRPGRHTSLDLPNQHVTTLSIDGESLPGSEGRRHTRVHLCGGRAIRRRNQEKERQPC